MNIYISCENLKPSNTEYIFGGKGKREKPLDLASRVLPKKSTELFVNNHHFIYHQISYFNYILIDYSLK